MENASKALIIAGAILISILLIGVGMMVFQGAQGGIEGAIAQMSSQEKEMFNQNFTRYEGEKVTGSNVRALIQNVISSNHTNQDIEGKIVSVNGKNTSTDLSALKLKVNTGKTYKVLPVYNDATGLITSINIEGLEGSK